MMQNDFLMDLLTVYSVMLQVQNLEQEKKSVKNEDLLSELQVQDKKYLERMNEKLDLILTKLG